MKNKKEPVEKTEGYAPVAKDKIRILPLGGMREIGMNMTVIEYENDIIIIDCGIAFPDENMPGVDTIIPDFTYLRQHKENIRGLFFTHGHEDHIGAVAWFMREFAIPVYGTPLTIKLANNKLQDVDRGGSENNDKNDPRFHVVEAGETVQAGKFRVEFIHVNHSIADACALAIHTPLGAIIHSGDFKIDFTPIDGKPIALNRFSELGQEGVLALLLESTNVEIPGVTPSETLVGESFSEIFANSKGRVFVATFSSNVFRIQQVISAAEEHKRKYVLLGYSMNKVFEAADSLGYITYNKDNLIEVWDAKQFEDHELVFITTGSQGEFNAALSRMAFSEHKHVNIKKGDTVILSSSKIPGNEKSIYRVINELFKIGADVYYESLDEIHVSGHAYRDELQLLINLCNPHYFIPVHGEYRHLHKNAELARSQGIPNDRVFILNNGDIFEFNKYEGAIAGFVEESTGVLIDGGGVGDVNKGVLRERKLLGDDGVVTCSMVVNTKKNVLAASPEIQALGFIYTDDRDILVKNIQKAVEAYAEKTKKKDRQLSKWLRHSQLREQIRNVLYSETKRRPMVILSVLEI